MYFRVLNSSRDSTRLISPILCSRGAILTTTKLLYPFFFYIYISTKQKHTTICIVHFLTTREQERKRERNIVDEFRFQNSTRRIYLLLLFCFLIIRNHFEVMKNEAISNYVEKNENRRKTNT